MLFVIAQHCEATFPALATLIYICVFCQSATSTLFLMQHKVHLGIDPKWTPASRLPSLSLHLSLSAVLDQ